MSMFSSANAQVVDLIEETQPSANVSEGSEEASKVEGEKKEETTLTTVTTANVKGSLASSVGLHFDDDRRAGNG